MTTGTMIRAARLLTVAGLALTTACTSTVVGTASPAGAELPRPAHVMVVVFENEGVDDVIGSPEAPYLTQLAGSAAAFSDSHGETHPSQPNYLALFSGSTQGVTDDSCPVELSGDNLAAQLLTAGHTFVGYSEGLPVAGYTGCSFGNYARKHNPWVDFVDLPPEVNQPLEALPADYAQLPTVSFVIPDLCNDMHDCGVPAGDAWAQQYLAPYVAWATENDSLLVVTFDEDRGTEENRIATIVAGAGVAAGTSGQRIDHYDVLRTIEDMYGLPALGQAAQARPITGIWTAG